MNKSTTTQNKTTKLRETEKIKIELEARARMLRNTFGLLTRRSVY